jgi:hypothetical protein
MRASRTQTARVRVGSVYRKDVTSKPARGGYRGSQENNVTCRRIECDSGCVEEDLCQGGRCRERTTLKKIFRGGTFTVSAFGSLGHSKASTKYVPLPWNVKENCVSTDAVGTRNVWPTVCAGIPIVSVEFPTTEMVSAWSRDLDESRRRTATTIRRGIA